MLNGRPHINNNLKMNIHHITYFGKPYHFGNTVRLDIN